jgi:FMN-dependent oxidoreductase (nitrilotriacetate monooxygenase family)
VVDRIHLGWFLDGFRVPAWNKQWSGTSARDWPTGRFYVDMARDLERGCFDYFMLEDNNYVPDDYGGNFDAYLQYGQRAPKHDPVVLATLIAAATDQLGVIATIATQEISPYRLARLFSTLDHVSAGRIGWNIVTGSNHRAAQNFGFDAQPEHDERYDRADDFIAAAKALWSSWEDDALRLDHEQNIYVAGDKVHDVDYKGAYYRTRGPLNTLPGPQKEPVFVQAGISSRGIKFSSRHADSVIATGNDPSVLKEIRDRVRRSAVEQWGRDPDEIKVMFLAECHFGESDQEASERVERVRQDRMDNYSHHLSALASVTMTDFSTFDPNSPLPEGLTTNGHQGQLNDMIRSKRTLREIAGGTLGNGLEFIGTPASVAAQMEEVAQEIGGDGFLITTLTPTRRYTAEIVDGLVPELQKRGLVRDRYEHPTLRQNLLAF